MIIFFLARLPCHGTASPLLKCTWHNWFFACCFSSPLLSPFNECVVHHSIRSFYQFQVFPNNCPAYFMWITSLTHAVFQKFLPVFPSETFSFSLGIFHQYPNTQLFDRCLPSAGSSNLMQYRAVTAGGFARATLFHGWLIPSPRIFPIQ